MFEKAKSLVRNDGLVLEKPGAIDGSYIVAGSANRIFCVSPGKGGSFNCVRSCINNRTKICEHVIAVAEKSGKLQQFVEWFRRSKCGASVSALALNGAPKSMGGKGNGRKRSNKKRANIEEVVNIFDENGIENLSQYLLSPSNTNRQNGKSINKKHINFFILDQMNFQEFNNNILSVHSAPPIVQQQISNPFFLRWVSGTTVSQCYGCNGSMPNPPMNMLDNLIVALKYIRHYRDRNTGQLHFSSQPQNVHFHLNLRCIHVKYPTFNPCHLTIDISIYPYLQPEQKFKLLTELTLVFSFCIRSVP